jgi:hypothetical protein
MKNLILTVLLAAGLITGGVMAMQAVMPPKHNCAHCKVKKSTCCPDKKTDKAMDTAANPSAASTVKN